ncbi:hypothetical protein A3F00_01825 [Candidatus Daviesbacteria bacterium RIFCSPHIGHO2_12_FULL_37_11]|uniref:DUF1003 domain-containing protein n=1 Tax=Candidatus Daviesbacteria bacterium RIFCSPHIGHO2_12_FULL_37_11 TaxID=1797777 RepID=A0A1F5KDI0_9BACT|nr:MAG: hypothetical protein A3F00_01825 [Candidatus Daviesbacteria bacterium RIFCSPHIGHO2_12_FULL_37_11]OGE45569.1 MAG: hypothetical protein A3B39_05170 [Candidatus Daviesbacteria bacterium RIFCSPLOWO2_01_FULL_37_10]
MVKKANQDQVLINKPKKLSMIEKLARDIPRWVGTPQSLIIHTIIFMGILSLGFFGFDFRTVNIVLTTWLSIEAIYLAIFIQMTVNRNTESIEDLQEDVEELSEDVEDIQEDIEDIEESHDEKSGARKIQDFLLDPLKKSGLI